MSTEPGSRRCFRQFAASAVAGCLLVTASLICPDAIAAGRASRVADAAHAKQRHAPGAAPRKVEQGKAAATVAQARRRAAKTRPASKPIVQRRVVPPSQSGHLAARPIPGQRATASAPAPHPHHSAHGWRNAATRAPDAERLASHIANRWRMPLPRAERIVRAAYAQARERNLSATLILAVVAQESSFRTGARSNRGAQGLMQVIPRYHPEKLKGLPRDALLLPETNIQVGTQVLAEYIERVDGRLDPALVKYSGKARAYPEKVRAVWTQLERVRSAEQEDI